MTIETKYNIGDTVYLFDGVRFSTGVIEKLTVSVEVYKAMDAPHTYKTPEIKYIILCQNARKERDESEIFGSKQDLLNHIDKSLP